jgi:PAS domain S-box-containing protein
MEGATRAESRYQALFDALAEPTVIVDAESGRVLEVNLATAHLYGYTSPSEMIGLGVADYSAQSEDTTRSPRIRKG